MEFNDLPWWDKYKEGELEDFDPSEMFSTYLTASRRMSLGAERSEAWPSIERGGPLNNSEELAAHETKMMMLHRIIENHVGHGKNHEASLRQNYTYISTPNASRQHTYLNGGAMDNYTTSQNTHSVQDNSTISSRTVVWQQQYNPAAPAFVFPACPQPVIIDQLIQASGIPPYHTLSTGQGRARQSNATPSAYTQAYDSNANGGVPTPPHYVLAHNMHTNPPQSNAVAVVPQPDQALTQNCPFAPSYRLTGHHRGISHEMRTLAVQVGMDLNNYRYQGELSHFHIQNSLTLEHMNCALFIRGIPPHATDKEVFDTIREGKVFSYSRKEPIVGRFDTSAVSISFVDRISAERYFLKGSCPGIAIAGSLVQIIWNRNRVGPAPPHKRHQTRVLHVTGPVEPRGVLILESYLKDLVIFDLVTRGEFPVDDDKMVSELVFASIRGQSRSAYKCLVQQFGELGHQGAEYTISFGPDPCDPMVIPSSSYPGYVEYDAAGVVV